MARAPGYSALVKGGTCRVQPRPSPFDRLVQYLRSFPASLAAADLARSLPPRPKLSIPHQPYSFLQQEFPGLSSAGLDLMCRLLCYDPEKRISAHGALRHGYFKVTPCHRGPGSVGSILFAPGRQGNSFPTSAAGEPLP